jgi:hypothetical protein
MKGDIDGQIPGMRSLLSFYKNMPLKYFKYCFGEPASGIFC